MKVPEKALGTTRRCFRCGEWIAVAPEQAIPVEPANSEGDLAAGPLSPVKQAEYTVEPTPPPPLPAFSAAPPGAAAPIRSIRKEVSKLRIGELLVQEGIVGQHELERALARQKEKGGKLVENLIALDFLDTRTFLNFLSRQPGTASIDLLNYTIPSEVIDLVPAEFALKHELLPIDKMGKQLTVGMACPLDSDTVEELVQMTGMKIRPLLVSMNDIRIALKRYYQPKTISTFSLPAVSGMSGNPPPEPAPPTSKETLPKVESALTFETVVHLVREVTSLPALPETVREVKAAMEDPTISPLQIAEIIRRDPSISAKVLGLANSPAYGLNHNIDSVELATSLLGLREIYSVVLSSAVIDYFEASKSFDYRAFWKRSIICATAAKLVARACGRNDLSGIFAAGLLHDIGRVVLSEVFPQKYKEVDQRLPDLEVIKKENELFGVAHPEVGYILAKGWKVPVAMCEAIRFHHDFHQAQHGRDIVAIISLAALMTDAYGRITKENVSSFAGQCKELLQELGITEREFLPVLAETAASIKTELAQPTVTAMEGNSDVN